MPIRQILVTAALPYVNGHIHIGHLVEYIQADIWVRFQRLCGHRVAYICADDTHGTATMIRARNEGRSEQSIIAEMNVTHHRDFADFAVAFDHYGSTDSASNRRLVGEFWQALTAAPGVVHHKEVTQLFDPKAGCFLADRFVKGTCPNCHSPDQYGDSCDKCNTTYSPADLKNPVSTLTGATPEIRSATHLFVPLEPLRDAVEAWMNRSPAPLQQEVANWLKGTFLAPDKPLRDWDVSRPAPYFGFEIPGEPGQYFYVWVDAPVGYLASLTDAIAAGKLPGPVASWWPASSAHAGQQPAEIHHFIGKDITYFHTVFWPAMLTAAGYQLPTQVHIHGFLTVDGEKMSKSKGTFVRARTYLETVGDPAYMRYYFASKLNRKVEDIDLNLGEFVDKVNSDLVGKVVNLASRCANFIAASGLAPGNTTQWPAEGVQLLDSFRGGAEEISALYDSGDYAEAMRRIMALADQANRYVETAAPWKLAKDASRAAELQIACTIALNLFWRLTVLLAPVLPKLAEQAGALFADRITHWDDLQRLHVGKPIAPFQHLLGRLQMESVKAMIAASASEVPPPRPVQEATAAAGEEVAADDAAAVDAEPLLPTIAFEDFAKLDLRVARIVSAEEVPKAKKILKLTLSLGGSHQRTVFAGIKTAYPDAHALVGRLVTVVANLAPRTMSFGVSEGMVIAAGPGSTDIFLLAPDSGAKPGQRVH